MVMGRQDYQWKHEPCLYGWKDGAGHLWNSDRKQTTLLAFDKPIRNGAHPTMKPVELFVYQLTNNTKGEDIILDTFLGSGTSIIAAQKTGRVCYGLELDPKYVDVIIQRYVDYVPDAVVKKNGIIEAWEKSTTEGEDPQNSHQRSSGN
jgi:DNA modification methylase